MYKHYTNNVTNEVLTVEVGEEITCPCCEQELEVGAEYTETSVEVRFLAGDNVIEHDYEVVIGCTACNEDKRMNRDEYPCSDEEVRDYEDSTYDRDEY